jgi:serine/threonine protein kinase
MGNLSETNKTKKDIMKKLRKECELLRKVDNNPNIVKYYGFLEDKHNCEASIFLEYVPAGTL